MRFCRYESDGRTITSDLGVCQGLPRLGEHRHPALVEQFTVLEGALSIFLERPDTWVRFGGREGIRTPGLLIANGESLKLRRVATIS
jgi:hypothetical protein